LISKAPEPQDLLSLVRSGNAPPEIRRFAAKRLLPLEPVDQLHALLAVLFDEDAEIAAAAARTLRDAPPDEIAAFLQHSDPSGIELDAVARHSEDPFVLEQVVRHRNVADETLEDLARTATGAPQEALIVNQVRLLRQPGLIEALFENPALTLDGRRRLNEIREEFFEKQARRREAERARVEEEAARALAEEEGEAAEGVPAETAAEDPEASLNIGAAYRRIAVMTVAEKIDLAYKGSKEERRILIGDSNKLVGLAVLKARGLTLGEVELFASMRHLDDEIFRKIAQNREWMRKNSIVHALVKNPGVPLAFTLPLVKQLGMRELRGIIRDPNLPEGVRITARKLMVEKRR
jgi:hypothetical protein